MDWFKGKITGTPCIERENMWFSVDFPLNQSTEYSKSAHIIQKFTHEFVVSCLNLVCRENRQDFQRSNMCKWIISILRAMKIYTHVNIKNIYM